jgi:hypothetical protein
MNGAVSQCPSRSWTPCDTRLNIEESCSVFADAVEYPIDDIYLAHLVRLQHIIERIGQSILHNNGETSSITNAPINMHVEAFQAEPHSFRDSLPLELQQNGKQTARPLGVSVVGSK